jgi:chitodextrinase
MTLKAANPGTYTLTYYASDGLYHSSPVVPPSQVTGLTVTGVTYNSVALSWAAATAGTNAIAGYYVYRNGSQLGSVTGTTYTDTGLSSPVTYAYTVVAYDTSGTLGTASSPVSATTTFSITTTSPLPNATQTFAYSLTLTSQGGIAPLTWTLAANNGTNTWTVSPAGVLSGTPANAETDTLTVRLADSAGNTRTAPLVVTVNAVVVGGLVHGSQYTVNGSGFGTRANYNYLGLTWNVAGNTYTHMHRAWWDCSTTQADGGTIAQFQQAWGGWQPSIAEGSQWGYASNSKQYPANGYQGTLGNRCVVTGYCAGNVLTVTAVTSGNLTSPGTTQASGDFGVAMSFALSATGAGIGLGFRTTGQLTGTPNGVGTYSINNATTLGSAGSPVTLYGYRSCGLEVLAGGPSQSGYYAHRYGAARASDGAVSIYTGTDPAAGNSLSGYFSYKTQNRGSGKGFRYWIDGSASGVPYKGDQWYMDFIGVSSGGDNGRKSRGISYAQNNPVSGKGGVLTPWYREEVLLFPVDNGPYVRRNQQPIQYKNNNGNVALGYAGLSYATDPMQHSWFMIRDAVDNIDVSNNPVGPGEIAATDMYFDYTAARVEIAQSGIVEPQILLSWSNTSINYVFNKGSLVSGAATLNVYDSTDTIIYTTSVTVN